LDVARLLQPAPQRLHVDLIAGRVASFGRLELALHGQAVFLERLTTPEQQPHAILELAVPHDRIAVEEPHWMRVPYFVLGVGEFGVDLFGQEVADLAIRGSLRGVVANTVSVHGPVLPERER
jgi:hypothetical protein